jgi:hypothetical protein
MVPQSRIYNLGPDAVLDTALFECAQLATDRAAPIASKARNALRIDATELLILFPLTSGLSTLIRIVYSARGLCAACVPARQDLRRFSLSDRPGW